MKKLVTLLIILFFTGVGCEKDVCLKCTTLTAPVGLSALYPHPYYLYDCTFNSEIICGDFTYKEIKEMEQKIITYNANGYIKSITQCVLQ